MIPKSEAMKVQQENNAKQIAALEEEIDAKIRAAPGLSVSVSVSGMPESVVNAIVDKYKRGGWMTKIDDGYDQRDQESWKNLILC